MSDLGIREFDSANYLNSVEEIAFYLEDIIDSGDPAVIARGLGAVARSKGMTEVAKAAGVSREHLYRALSSEGNPELGTVIKVLDALGLKLVVAPKSTQEAA
ncbi:MAG TPA: addiction module antidote protein [Devosia sp.]|jgi:probable addiction module antidote protein